MRSFSEAAVPDAGTKIDVSGSYINQFGLCPISCCFVTVDLQISRISGAASASGVSGFFGSYRPNPTAPTRSTRGRITFSYADDHTATDTIVIMLDKANKRTSFTGSCSASPSSSTPTPTPSPRPAFANRRTRRLVARSLQRQRPPVVG